METLIQLRQHLHQHPETSFNEFETAKSLKATLTTFGFEAHQFIECAAPGFYLDVQGTGQPTAEPRCIALRADMDALPMLEENEGLPYKSVNPTAAHMCGHDGHCAALVGVAKALLLQVNQIPSNCKVRLLFQPAEEDGQGAQKMIAEGVLDGVNEIYACHNFPGNTLGQLQCPEGPAASSSQWLQITVSGKGGHGAEPEKCNDVVLTACQIVPALTSIPSRAISCHDAAVLTICQFNSGSAANVLPTEAVLKGSIRTYSVEVLETIKARIKAIVTSIAQANGCSSTVEYLSDCPPTINHAAYAKIVKKVWGKEAGEESVIEGFPSPGSEDFSYYLQKVPGAMFGAFSGQPGWLHTSHYNFSDELLPYIIRAFLGIVSDRLSTELSLQL